MRAAQDFWIHWAGLLVNFSLKVPLSGKCAQYWKRLAGQSILGCPFDPQCCINRHQLCGFGVCLRVHHVMKDVWPLYLFFPSELPVIQGERWCPRCPGSKCISSQWWGWVQTSTHPLGHRLCRPSSHHRGKDSCQESHAQDLELMDRCPNFCRWTLWVYYLSLFGCSDTLCVLQRLKK